MESGKRSLFGAQVGYTPVRRFSSSPFVGRIHLSAMSVVPSSGFDRLFSDLLQSWLIQEQTLNFWDPYMSAVVWLSTPCQQRWLVDDLFVASGENCDTDVNQSELGCGAKTIWTYSASKKHRFHTFGKQSSRNLHTLCSIWLCWPIDNAQGWKDTAVWHSEN